MFERYTDKARRVIFFARYEASQLGSPTIDPEHLLLGLLREDRALALRYLKTQSALEATRDRLERHAEGGPRVSTSVDLPLNHEAKRVLAYGAEESERMNHSWIGTPHLLLGLLREQHSLAAKLLIERGVTPARVRQEVAAGSSIETTVNEPPAPPGPSELPGSLVAALAHLEATAGITVARGPELAGAAGVVDLAVYEGRGAVTDGLPLSETGPGGRVAELRSRLRSIARQLQVAIGQHEFEIASQLSSQERLVRQELREAQPGGTADRAPFLCILLLPPDLGLVKLRARIEALFNAGVTHVWMLHPAEKRIYTATPAEGLREFKGEILRVEHPRLELEGRALFD